MTYAARTRPRIDRATGMRICAWCYADLSAATNSQRVFCDHTCRNRAKAKRGRVAARKGKKPMLYRRLNGYG